MFCLPCTFSTVSMQGSGRWKYSIKSCWAEMGGKLNYQYSARGGMAHWLAKGCGRQAPGSLALVSWNILAGCVLWPALLALQHEIHHWGVDTHGVLDGIIRDFLRWLPSMKEPLVLWKVRTGKTRGTKVISLLFGAFWHRLLLVYTRQSRPLHDKGIWWTRPLLRKGCQESDICEDKTKFAVVVVVSLWAFCVFCFCLAFRDRISLCVDLTVLELTL